MYKNLKELIICILNRLCVYIYNHLHRNDKFVKSSTVYLWRYNYLFPEIYFICMCTYMYKYLQYFINFIYTFIFIASLYVCMYDIYVKHKYIHLYIKRLDCIYIHIHLNKDHTCVLKYYNFPYFSLKLTSQCFSQSFLLVVTSNYLEYF